MEQLPNFAVDVDCINTFKMMTLKVPPTHWPIHWSTDTSDLGHFGPEALQAYQNSDPGHCGMTKVSRHLGTGAEVSYGLWTFRQ